MVMRKRNAQAVATQFFQFGTVLGFDDAGPDESKELLGGQGVVEQLGSRRGHRSVPDVNPHVVRGSS